VAVPSGAAFLLQGTLGENAALSFQGRFNSLTDSEGRLVLRLVPESNMRPQSCLPSLGTVAAPATAADGAARCHAGNFLNRPQAFTNGRLRASQVRGQAADALAVFGE